MNLFKVLSFLLLSWLSVACDAGSSKDGADSPEKRPKGGHIFEPYAGPLIDDARKYLKPGISAAELLRARGYIARSYNFITQDDYMLSIVRGTNPLFNDGQRGLDSKLPILFVNAATLSGASYLVNSIGVLPRAHRLEEAEGELDLSKLSVQQLKERLGDDPAVMSLPFLALNLGYEIWILERRGYSSPRRIVGRKKRSLADAWLALPNSMLGNVLDGFSLDGNMKPGRPVRTKTHSRNPLTVNQNDTIRFEAGQPEVRAKELEATDRVKRRRSKRDLLPSPMDLVRTSANILQFMFMLAKLPGALKRLGPIKHDFIDTFDPQFWSFSLDEQAAYDFPQAIDFVLERTGKAKLHTVGLSCSGAIQLMSLAERPQLANKISRAVMWAPSINLGSNSDSVYHLSKLVPLLQGYTGPIPFVFMFKEVQFWIQSLCESEMMQYTVCEALADAIGGFSGGQAPLRPFMAAVFLTPAGTRELTQLAQMARTQRPCKYSFNTKEKNVKFYGQEEPPCYDLARIQLRNISFYVGAYDRLVSPDDIATTELQMRVPSELHIIKGDKLHFNHFGSLLHKNTDELVVIPSLLDMERSQAEERRQQRKQKKNEDNNELSLDWLKLNKL